MTRISEEVRSALDAGRGVVALETTLVDDAFRARLRALQPDVVFATEREHEVVGTLDTRWVLKRGANGLRVDGQEHPAVTTGVVDTTGAGDAFNAGLAVALASGKTLVEAVQYGCCAGAMACTRLGVIPSMGRQADIDTLYRQHFGS